MGVLNRSAIKYEAKNFISTDTRWLKMFFAAIIIYLLQDGFAVWVNVKNILSNGMVYFNDYYDSADNAAYGVGGTNFVISILLLPFMVSLAGYYLNHIRGFNPEWKSIYKEGFDRFGKYLSTMLVTNIIIGLWSLLFIVPGVIKGYSYSQVKYILHDNPNLNSQDARRMSEIMTKGYKSDLFVLDLSFLAWYLLVACTAGIAIIYVTPYVETTKAMYYENLKKHAIDSGLISPDSFGIIPVMPDMNFDRNPMDYNGFSYGSNGMNVDFTVEDGKAPEEKDNSDGDKFNF